MLRLTRMLAAAAVLCLAWAGAAPAATDHDQNPNWLNLRRMMFGDRVVHPNADRILKIFVPKKAEDASTVPVMIRTAIAQSADRYIRHLWLVIDNNPSPVGVRFTMTPESGRADIETRIRIESFTPVRAVAELNDGTLWMSTATVLAAGGCSAPAKVVGDPTQTGRMKFKFDPELEPYKPAIAQLMVHHPNDSGMSQTGEGAWFVKQVKVWYGEKMVMQADVDFTISENPNFRFYFVPDGKSELRAEVVDTKDLRFDHRVVVTPPAIEPAPMSRP